jgi:hypothetical protein
MTQTMAPCPVNGCKRRHGPTYLMCRIHWWRVSAPTRDAVYEAYNRWQNGDATLAELRVVQDEAIAEASR